MLQIKRAYEKAAKSDGQRVLVDRVWPRGVSKKDLQLDQWTKDIAPSTVLRKWFGHDPKRWQEFKRRYKNELKAHATELTALRALGRKRRVTLIYGAKDERYNQAVVLKEILSR